VFRQLFWKVFFLTFILELKYYYLTSC